MYPVMLNLTEKKVLVVGGGSIATKKIEKLLQDSPHIVVVSPTITPTITKYVNEGEITWLERPFESKDTEGFFLVIAATNNSVVNLEVKKSCDINQLVNIVSQPDESSFYNMASIDRGKLKIAISTEGASPLLSKRIKKDLLNFFDESYEDYLDFLFVAREKIKITIYDEEKKRELLKQLLDEKYRLSVSEREHFFQKDIFNA